MGKKLAHKKPRGGKVGRSRINTNLKTGAQKAAADLIKLHNSEMAEDGTTADEEIDVSQEMEEQDQEDDLPELTEVESKTDDNLQNLRQCAKEGEKLTLKTKPPVGRGRRGRGGSALSSSTRQIKDLEKAAMIAGQKFQQGSSQQYLDENAEKADPIMEGDGEKGDDNVDEPKDDTTVDDDDDDDDDDGNGQRVGVAGEGRGRGRRRGNSRNRTTNSTSKLLNQTQKQVDEKSQSEAERNGEETNSKDEEGQGSGENDLNKRRDEGDDEESEADDDMDGGDDSWLERLGDLDPMGLANPGTGLLFNKWSNEVAKLVKRNTRLVYQLQKKINEREKSRTPDLNLSSRAQDELQGNMLVDDEVETVSLPPNAGEESGEVGTIKAEIGNKDPPAEEMHDQGPTRQQTKEMSGAFKRNDRLKSKIQTERAKREMRDQVKKKVDEKDMSGFTDPGEDEEDDELRNVEGGDVDVEEAEEEEYATDAKEDKSLVHRSDVEKNVEAEWLLDEYKNMEGKNNPKKGNKTAGKHDLKTRAQGKSSTLGVGGELVKMGVDDYVNYEKGNEEEEEEEEEKNPLALLEVSDEPNNRKHDQLNVAGVFGLIDEHTNEQVEEGYVGYAKGGEEEDMPYKSLMAATNVKAMSGVYQKCAAPKNIKPGKKQQTKATSFAHDNVGVFGLGKQGMAALKEARNVGDDSHCQVTLSSTITQKGNDGHKKEKNRARAGCGSTITSMRGAAQPQSDKLQPLDFEGDATKEEQDFDVNVAAAVEDEQDVDETMEVAGEDEQDVDETMEVAGEDEQNVDENTEVAAEDEQDVDENTEDAVVVASTEEDETVKADDDAEQSDQVDERLLDEYKNDKEKINPKGGKKRSGKHDLKPRAQGKNSAVSVGGAFVKKPVQDYESLEKGNDGGGVEEEVKTMNDEDEAKVEKPSLLAAVQEMGPLDHDQSLMKKNRKSGSKATSGVFDDATKAYRNIGVSKSRTQGDQQAKGGMGGVLVNKAVDYKDMVGSMEETWNEGSCEIERMNDDNEDEEEVEQGTGEMSYESITTAKNIRAMSSVYEKSPALGSDAPENVNPRKQQQMKATSDNVSVFELGKQGMAALKEAGNEGDYSHCQVTLSSTIPQKGNAVHKKGKNVSKHASSMRRAAQSQGHDLQSLDIEGGAAKDEPDATEDETTEVIDPADEDDTAEGADDDDDDAEQSGTTTEEVSLYSVQA